MSIQELKNPYRRDALTGDAYFLCWDCLTEKKGACSICPYHRVAAATQLPPPSSTRPRKVVKIMSSNNNNNNEKTGFIYVDKLSKEELTEAIKKTRKYWDSLTQEERVSILDDYYTTIRERMKSKSGLIT
jgi:hypothetical protein